MSSRRFAYDLLGDGLAVADSRSNRISMLNASAAVAWIALNEDNHSVSELVRVMQEHFPSQKTEFSESLRALLLEWKGYGWARCDRQGTWSIVADEAAVSPLSGRYSPTDIGGLTHGLLWSRRVGVSSSAVCLEIRGSEALSLTPDFHRMVCVFGALPDAQHDRTTKRVLIAEQEDGVAVSEEGRTIIFPDLLSASGAFGEFIIRAAYPEAVAHTLFHAAAVAKERGCIILPAVSGSGKTTLTAYLLARGWHYGGDDIVGIGRSTSDGAMTLLPLPTPLGIKQGSVEVLSEDYPVLPSLKAIQFGRKSVRYLPVDRASIVPEGSDWRRPRALVFPHYQPGAALELEPLSEWDALSILLDAGAGALSDTGMNFDSFHLFLDLLKAVPRFRMRYSSLEEANRQLETLL